jgi:hypothetical protein
MPSLSRWLWIGRPAAARSKTDGGLTIITNTKYILNYEEKDGC